MCVPPESLSANTRLFAVWGQPVRHSLSPCMHNAALRHLGLDAVYLAFEVAPAQLAELLAASSQLGVGGINLTLPLKEAAFEVLDDLSESATRSGTVNTVEFFDDAPPRGHSTDGYGLEQALREAFARDFRGRRVLILGCGGAGRAAALHAALAGAAGLCLANRTVSRARRLADEIRLHVPAPAVDVCGHWPPSPQETRNCDLILQCTSSGMRAADAPLLTPGHFRAGQDLLDMTYVLEETPTMRAAAAAGASTVNGLGMLLHQGARSLEIWTGREAPLEVMRAALRQRIYGESS